MYNIKLSTIENIASFYKMVRDVQSDVFVSLGRYRVDAKSIMGLYSLDLSNDLQLDIIEKSVGEEKYIVEECKKLGILI